jgi:DNA-binding response OmpR family regulator
MKGTATMPTRIMVVNDTQEILDLFREILLEEGYEPILYSYAIQDLAEVERVKPDLIILDHIIGSEAVGWQMLQKLKMRRSTATIPVIVCTAAVKAVQEMEGYMKSKNVGLVLKPFDIDDLLLAIKTALKVSVSPEFPTSGEHVEDDQQDG